MKIENLHGVEPRQLRERLIDLEPNTRFTFTISFSRLGLKIEKVRLRKSKQYCGNHPGACQTSGHKAEQKRTFLEGADWVEFNDMLNDVLDYFCASASVFSRPSELLKPLIIRIGTRRRVNYDMEVRSNGIVVFNPTWVPLGDFHKDYEDHTEKRKPVHSTFPEGTPGIYPALNYVCVG